MKKALLLGLISAALVPTYAATSWLLGREIEAALDEQYRELKEQPYVKLVRREYERGVFSSTELVTFQLVERFPRASGQTWRELDGEAEMPEVFGADPVESKPLRFTVRSEIRHGPLPGLSAVGAAVADSELEPELEGEAAAQLAHALGGAKPLVAHTVFHFDGGGNTVFTSPAFAMRIAGAEDDTMLLSSGGLSADLAFTQGMKHYRVKGRIPKLELEEDEGISVAMMDLEFDAVQQRVFEDDPLLVAGTQNLALGELAVSNGQAQGPKFLVKGLAYRVDTPVTGDFLDVEAKLGAEALEIGGKQYGPVHYDLSLRHLHARSTARLYRALARLYTETAPTTPAAEVLVPLAEPALALLNNGAEVSLDRLSFTSPEGEARATLRARLSEAAPAEPRSPLMLLSRLDIAAELGFPEALASSLPAAVARAEVAPADGQATDAAAADAHGDKVRQQVAALTAQGYLERHGGLLKSRIELKNGRLAVNGKPLRAMSPTLLRGKPEMHPMQ